MLGSDPPPPPHGRKGSPSPNPPPGTATKEGEGGVGQMGFHAIPPPQSNFLPAHSFWYCGGMPPGCLWREESGCGEEAATSPPPPWKGETPSGRGTGVGGPRVPCSGGPLPSPALPLPSTLWLESTLPP